MHAGKTLTAKPYYHHIQGNIYLIRSARRQEPNLHLRGTPDVFHQRLTPDIWMVPNCRQVGCTLGPTRPGGRLVALDARAIPVPQTLLDRPALIANSGPEPAVIPRVLSIIHERCPGCPSIRPECRFRGTIQSPAGLMASRIHFGVERSVDRSERLSSF